MTPWSASKGSPCPAGSGSVWPWPGPRSPIRGCWCSTTPPRQSTRAWRRRSTPSNIASKLTGGDQVLQVPLNFGYAAATTTYRSVGWALADAVKDIENIRRHFIRRYAKPMHTYIWGHSEGGMVTG